MSIASIKTVLLCLALALFCCGQGNVALAKSSKKAANAQPAAIMSHNDSLRFKLYYYEAVNRQIIGEHEAAYALLRQCLAINPLAAEVYFRLARYDGELQGDSVALADMKRAHELSPDNTYYLEQLANEYVINASYAEAIECYERLYQARPDRTELLDVLLKLYAFFDDYDNMLRTIGRQETADGVTEQTVLCKMRIYAMQGLQDEELAVLTDLVRQQPTELNYRVMLGNWLLQHKRSDEAAEQYAEVLRQDPRNTAAQMSMIDYYKVTAQELRADSLQEELLVNPNTTVENKMQLMRRLVAENEKQGGDAQHVINTFRKILAPPQQTADMAELFAAYLALKKQPQDSINSVLRIVLAISPDNISARLQLMQDAWAAENYTLMHTLATQGTMHCPDELPFFYFLAMANIQLDDDQAALAALRQGLAIIESDPSQQRRTTGLNTELVADCYSLLGDLLQGLDDVQAAFEAYDNCLLWNADNASCLNNYAYYLCEMVGKTSGSKANNDTAAILEKAERMSLKALKAEPANANYLDTYAWILFRMGKADEALPYIEMALEFDTNDSSVINDHAETIRKTINQ